MSLLLLILPNCQYYEEFPVYELRKSSLLFHKGFGGFWGMLAVGLFAEEDKLESFSRYAGLFHGGGFYLLGVQLLACVCFTAWASTVTLLLIWVSNMPIKKS